MDTIIKKASAILRGNLAWVLLLIISIIFSFNAENFFTVRNMLNILNQYAYIIIAALGVSVVMMSGNMDLSIGFAMSINGVLCATLLTKYHVAVPIIMIACILIGMFLCVINVILSQLLKIAYIFVSFGTMVIYQGLAFVLSNSKTISGFSQEYKFIGQGTLFGTNITIAILITAVLLMVFSFIMNKTYFGRYVFAIGGNKDAARLAGINVKKVEIIIGLFCGAMCGLASMIQTTRIGAATASTSVGIEFTIIVGLLLGGVSIRGGEGKINGCVAGILIIAILGNGMQLADLNVYYQYVVKGIIMLATIGMDTYQYTKKQNMKKIKTA
jgi:ribose transport system permease protein